MCVECPIEYSQRCYQVSFSHVSVQNVGVHIPLVVLPSFFSTMWDSQTLTLNFLLTAACVLALKACCSLRSSSTFYSLPHLQQHSSVLNTSSSYCFSLDIKNEAVWHEVQSLGLSIAPRLGWVFAGPQVLHALSPSVYGP